MLGTISGALARSLINIFIYFAEACKHSETTNQLFIVQKRYHNVSSELLTINMVIYKC